MVLEGCAESSNTAQFTIKRTVPALNTGNQQNGPSFTIYFTNWGNGWRVSNVNSSNCNNLIHQSLVNSFRSHNNEKRRYANESFYTHDLKNMTDNEICPAHINKLTTVFSNYVANL